MREPGPTHKPLMGSTQATIITLMLVCGDKAARMR